MEKLKTKNKKSKLPRLVITGSEGLIGRKLCQHFKGKFEILKLDLALGHDLANETFVGEWFKENRNLYGMIVSHAVNAVAHTAGKGKKKEPHEMPLDELRRYFEVNSVSAFDVCRNFVKNNKSGVVINISSLYGSVSPHHEIYKNLVKPIGYSMSKAAIVIMGKYLATYYAPKFRFNTVVFGGVPNSKPDPEIAAEYGRHAPLGRFMKIDEVTSVFDFLLDPKSSYVTGTEIFVDGGWTAW